MTILVTGSSGHLGEALMRRLREQGRRAIGLDLRPGAFTDRVGSILDRDLLRASLAGVRTVFHAATLHKPHVATHTRQAFVDTNISGTLQLLEAAVAEGVEAFVYTSTTSVFGDALVPAPGAPAAWVTEDTVPRPKNIYGVTKAAAEDLCQLFQRNQGLPCVVLRTARFFPEPDDARAARASYEDANLKLNEFLHRRVELADVVDAHLLAARQAPALGFARYILSATTPFAQDDLAQLRVDAPAVVRRLVPGYEAAYLRRGWRLPPGIDRVYVNERARRELGWRPRYDFAHLIEQLRAGAELRSPLAVQVGAKGYHAESFAEGPYPVEEPGGD